MTSTNVTRHFRDPSNAEIADIEQANLLVDMGWRGATTWDDLLKSSRVLIISEAGAGKTYECRVRCCQSYANPSLHDGDRSLMFSAQAAI